MIRAIIIFKNRQRIELNCESFKVEIHKMSGKIVGIHFTGCEDDEPFYLDLDEVLAVVKRDL